MNLVELDRKTKRAWLSRQEVQPLNACIATKQTSPTTLDIYLISQIGKWSEFCITVPMECDYTRIIAEVDNLHRLFAQKVAESPERNS